MLLAGRKGRPLCLEGSKQTSQRHDVIEQLAREKEKLFKMVIHTYINWKQAFLSELVYHRIVTAMMKSGRDLPQLGLTKLWYCVDSLQFSGHTQACG